MFGDFPAPETILLTCRPLAAGHHFAAYEDTTSVPRLVARAHGVILELGPGIGNQLPRFDASRIAHVYGVESNPAFAAPLRDRLRAVGATNGLEAKYTPLICRIEDEAALARAGVVDGSVDCVVSMQVLCSLPDPRGTARQLYRLLKPGGELLFWEHSSHSGFVTRCVQCMCFLLSGNALCPSRRERR